MIWDGDDYMRYGCFDNENITHGDIVEVWF